jgi:hypothetical protein
VAFLSPVPCNVLASVGDVSAGRTEAVLSGWRSAITDHPTTAMIRFTPTSIYDLPQIGEWISADLDHAGKMSSEWWMQGTILSCCAEDAGGPVMYLRIDREYPNARLHIQFAPAQQVSKIRVASAFIEGIPRMAKTMKDYGYLGMVFESCSESLVKFMERMKFVPYVGHDYVLKFEEAS